MPDLFTEEEKAVIAATVELWNKFLLLPLEHPDDAEEVRHAIHLVQNVVLGRPGRRNYNLLSAR